MSEELESTQSDASTASSEPSQSDTGTGGGSQESSEQKTDSQDEHSGPFHTHPRFKELVDQKNQFQEQLKTLQQNFEREKSEFQQRLHSMSQPQKQEAKDELVERLAKIDPDFADRIKSFEAMKQELQGFKEWQQQAAMQNLQSQAKSSLEKLHTDSKVPTELRPMYESQIKALADQNPNLRVEDLPTLYKQVHESFSKYLDTRDRTAREAYLKEKKSDAGIPAGTQRGQRPPARKADNTNAKAPKPGSGEERQATVNEIMNMLREGRDV